MNGQFELLAQFAPGGDRSGGGDVDHDAFMVQDRAQQTQPVILPLLMWPGGVNQGAQVTQV